MKQLELEKQLEHLHTDSYAWALRCCLGERELAKESLQNTYLKILEGKAQFKGQAKFKTWLFSVIRFTAIDAMRKLSKQREKQLNYKQQMDAMAEEVIPISQSEEPSDLINFKNALKSLSPQQNQVLHLVFYQNCTIQEAAEIMEIQLGTARTHYKRGKDRLRKELKRGERLRD